MSLKNIATTNWSTSYTNVEGLEDFSYDKWDILLHQENTISVDDANNTFAKLNALSYQSQYNEIVSQYDALINDSSYKGINLLQNNSLTVRFSEDGNSKLDIEGKDMSSVMNEESANMLALQTRQQLAINALSLSSQGAQAVLKLF